MREKVKRQSVGVNRVVLAGLIVGMALVVNSAARAASAGTAAKPAKEATTFDPFSLKTIVASSTSSGDKVGSPAPTASVNRVRQPIRVPSRPTYRSAFRPGLDWKTATGT